MRSWNDFSQGLETVVVDNAPRLRNGVWWRELKRAGSPRIDHSHRAVARLKARDGFQSESDLRERAQKRSRGWGLTSSSGSVRGVP